MAKSIDYDFGTTGNIFRQCDELYEEKGLVGVPLQPNQKRPAVREWQKLTTIGHDQRAILREQYAGCHIGLIAGTALKADRLLCFVDVDCPGLVRCAKAIVAPFVCGKRGSKGETIFAQAVTGPEECEAATERNQESHRRGFHCERIYGDSAFRSPIRMPL